MKLFYPVLALLLPFGLLGQEPNPTQSANAPAAANNPNPIFRVQVTSRSVQAVSYRNRSGWTKVDFQGTSIAPQAKGTAEVNSRLGHMEVKIDVKKLPSPRTFGSEFLTYVLWAITPDGHAANLGEVVPDPDGSYKATVTTELQSFGLIIAAEPYFAVRQPSDVVVMENVVRQDTRGKYEVIDAKYELLKRGQYNYQVPESQQHPIPEPDKKSPLWLYEAMNAVQIAQYAKADQYGGDTYQNAVKLLQQAQDYKERKQWNPSIMTAKEAVQKAEDARIISLRKQQQLALEAERQQAADRQAAAQRQALLAQQRAQEEARQKQLAEEQAQREAENRAAAERAKAEADAARAQADQARAQAQQAAAEADRLRQQAVQEKDQLRAQLLQQFNSVLPTRETPRGLVINLQDVLFDTGKYTLKEPARIALARISGIVASHPGLNLQIEGYTDSTGTVEFNQKLSEQRANTVRDFLLRQGLNTNSMTAVGYGPNYPVAPNDTAAGRQQNRRVELVVSGEVIGVKIGTPPTGATPGMAPTAGPSTVAAPPQSAPPISK
ncbi:MAG: OmpA family protein [Acidobacteriaceae bacterium]|nr:OmpA family protein [Acidobacteriaceae bacterium]